MSYLPRRPQSEQGGFQSFHYEDHTEELELSRPGHFDWSRALCIVIMVVIVVGCLIAGVILR